MKLSTIKIFCFVFILTLFGCKKDDTANIIAKYQKLIKSQQIGTEQNKAIDLLYDNNLENTKEGYEFYIIQKQTPLLLKKPQNDFTVPDEYIMLKFGDVLFPIKEDNPKKYFFHVKTINGKYGWIDSSSGISLNYNDDPNLYFFSKEYYLKNYKDTSGDIDKSNKIILIKNVVPLLLGNFKTDGWFYEKDYQLALELSLFGLSIAKDQDTFFYSASSYDWRVNEVVITNNLIADCYQKLKEYDKAIEIHQKLLKNYFWKRSDNSPIGGLNSSVKLEKIYLEKLKSEKIGTDGYRKTQDKIIESILITGDSYNIYTIMDKEWHLSAAEWLLVILKANVPREEFYQFCNILMNRTVSRGFSDLVLIHKAIEMYKDGKQTDAVKILQSINSKDIHKRSGKIEDWLSNIKEMPESAIYRYNF
ncbi:MAG: hypothetical protein A2086_08105 [Spirochaetes bacterium GWD1_27_9]|nr:MAG: hypothetical protein A2Z98_16255 [Spirochaetes bacterium GWB1_27_13]OHD24121.1 MAG: hypothetical protein A2Y34_09370 [Spirochaetes bacterium GWC1_27_15]OHD34483.1 MAG: hypothetical protein A2086_08105 [Spirochaetes bacterium GWD1_27_9]